MKKPRYRYGYDVPKKGTKITINILLYLHKKLEEIKETNKSHYLQEEGVR